MFLLNIKSKNKNSLINFLLFLYIFLLNNKKTIIFNKTNYISKLTLLKSPHVFKSAQHQFELKIYYTQILLFLNKKNNFIILLKKIIKNLFHDIKINFNFLINNNKFYFITDFYLKFRTFFSNFFFKCKNNSILNKCNIYYFLKLFNFIGNINLRKV
jgi:hypothetical protein